MSINLDAVVILILTVFWILRLAEMIVITSTFLNIFLGVVTGIVVVLILWKNFIKKEEVIEC